MNYFDSALGSAVNQLPDENYAHSLAFHRLWFDIGQTHDHETPTDRLFDAIWDNRRLGSSMIDPAKGKLINSASHLIVRFASDAESDRLLFPHTHTIPGCNVASAQKPSEHSSTETSKYVI